MGKYNTISNLKVFLNLRSCCYILVTCKALKNKFRINSINMKILVLLITILFYAIVSLAQSDIIYPTKNEKDIKRCKIIDVKNINIVYYQKGSETDSIEAIAICKDNLFINLKSSHQIPLYKDHDFDFYFNQYNNELVKRKTGIWISGSGIVLFAASIVTFNYCNTHSSCSEMTPTPYLLGIGAIVGTSIGIGLLTSARIKAKKYKKAMEMTNPNVNLSFGTTKDGIGLILNF